MTEHRYTYPTVIELRPSVRGALASQAPSEVRPPQVLRDAPLAPVMSAVPSNSATRDAW
jgi:hypothetical protein